MQKLRNELGPQQPSKYIEQEAYGPVYQLWPISTKLISTSIQNLIIQSKEFSCQFEDILIPSEIISKKKNSLWNEEQIIKIECKTDRISQKGENLLKSRKKIISRKTRNKFILLILKFYGFLNKFIFSMLKCFLIFVINLVIIWLNFKIELKFI